MQCSQEAIYHNLQSKDIAVVVVVVDAVDDYDDDALCIGEEMYMVVVCVWMNKQTHDINSH